MSRIGRYPVPVPAGVTIDIGETEITVKGKNGELRQPIQPGFKFTQENGQLVVERPGESKPEKSMHGLYRALIHNMVVGVTEGYSQTLELIGVGFKAEVKGQIVELNLGYSHSTVFVLPDEVSAEFEQKKGETPKLTLKSHDKQLLGQVVAKIQALRKPEPYKGKGIRKLGQYVRRKAGKAAGKK